MNDEAIISQWNIDEYGNPISVKTEQETQVSVGGNLVQLRGIPDEMEGVTIEDKNGNTFFRVENLDEVYDSNYAYYLMKDGNVQFNPSQNGKLLYFKYYSKGVTLLSVSRIYYKDSYDNVVKILEDLIKAGFDALKVLEVFGGAKEVIDRLERDLDNGRALATQLEDVIAEGKPLQENINADITEAKKWKDSLHKDVAEGKILQPQLHQDIIDGRETDANLTQTINSATELDDKIKTTGNASFIIEVDNWITSDDSDWAYMYSLTTSLNSSDLVFKTQEITTKGFEDCLLYSIVKDSNTIAFYTDDKVRTKVIINARQYGGTIQDFSVVNTDLISEGASNKYVTPQEKVNIGTIPDIKQQCELNKSSLEEKTKYVKAEKINISGYNNAQTRPLVTFISDDGNRADLQMLQLFNSKGIKGCTAMISGFIGQGNYMTGEELKQLHNAGWDIMLHDTHHREMATLTEEQLNTAMKTGKETIEALGIPCRGLATPYGSTNSLVKRVAEKYFDYTFGENIGKINTLPIISYDLERINHGGEGMTLAHYQNGVKKAIANNGWCVFCTHYYQLTEEQRIEMGELIDWIKSQGVDIVTVTEAMDIFGNVQEYRNYDTDEYFCVTKSGKTLTSENGATRIKPIGNVNNNTPITDFEFNKITVMNFTNGIELGFPVNAGVLETYRDKYEDFNTYCYQKITPVFGADNNIRYRQWDKANKKWQKWFSVKINLIDRVIIDNINGKTATSPIADFENGKITYTTISGSNTVGFPNERAGVLETNKMHSGDNGFQFQKYYESSLTRVWYRGTTASGGWSNWRKFGAFTTLSRPSSQISIPANSTVDSLVLSVPGLISDSIFNVLPDVALPSGIMYCVVPHSTSGNVIIRLVNITTSTVVVPSMNWLCNYTV